MSFKILEEWTGVVEKVNKKTFLAKLRSKIFNVDEEATINIDKLPKKELEHLQKGRIFIWKIGTFDGIKVESRFRFLKNKWTKKELERAQKKAKRLCKSIKWE